MLSTLAGDKQEYPLGILASFPRQVVHLDAPDPTNHHVDILASISDVGV